MLGKCLFFFLLIITVSLEEFLHALSIMPHSLNLIPILFPLSAVGAAVSLTGANIQMSFTLVTLVSTTILVFLFNFIILTIVECNQVHVLQYCTLVQF